MDRAAPSGTVDDRPISEYPWSGRPTQDGMRYIMLEFLQTERAGGMRPQLRAVAMKWARGATQAQIAKELRLSQPKVSRFIQEAKVFLRRPKS